MVLSRFHVFFMQITSFWRCRSYAMTKTGCSPLTTQKPSMIVLLVPRNNGRLCRRPSCASPITIETVSSVFAVFAGRPSWMRRTALGVSGGRGRRLSFFRRVSRWLPKESTRPSSPYPSLCDPPNPKPRKTYDRSTMTEVLPLIKKRVCRHSTWGIPRNQNSTIKCNTGYNHHDYY